MNETENTQFVFKRYFNNNNWDNITEIKINYGDSLLYRNPIIIYEGGIIYIFYVPDDRKIYLITSDNNLDTFSDPVVIFENSDVFESPQIAVDVLANNKIYIVFTIPILNELQLYFMYQDDNNTWIEPVLIDNVIPKNIQIVYLNTGLLDGRPYVVGYKSAMNPYPSGSGTFFTYSEDAIGSSWSITNTNPIYNLKVDSISTSTFNDRPNIALLNIGNDNGVYFSTISPITMDLNWLAISNE